MRLLRALRGERLDAPPIWLMRQAGRYLPEYREVRAQARDFIDFCMRPDLAAEATVQPLRRYRLDAAIVFADILLIPYAVGAGVRFVEGEGPRLDPVRTREEIEGLDWGAAAAGLAPVGETLAKVRGLLEAETALIGFAGGVWTVATYMIGGGKDPDRWAARTLAWREPETLALLLDRLVEATVGYLAAQARAGADVLKLFDSWSESLPEPLFERAVIAPTRRIVDGLRAAGIDTPIIGFARGAGGLAARYAVETGVDALALDMTNANSGFLRSLPQNLPVQGGFDPALLVAGGPDFNAEIDRLLAIGKDRPYVFNLGHGITPDTPPEHVARLVERVTAGR
jgi:uroporphyrinogen decarboxylase